MRFVLFRPGGRAGAIALVSVFWIVGGVSLAADLPGQHDSMPLWFLVPWLCGALAAGYMTLFRRPAELRIDGDTLIAIYGFSSRRVALSSLARIRPGRGGSNAVVIEISGEPSILVPSAPAVAQFADALEASFSTLPIDVGWRVDMQRSGQGRRA